MSIEALNRVKAWADHTNNPVMQAYLAQFGDDKVFSASELNDLRDALKYLESIIINTNVGNATLPIADTDKLFVIQNEVLKKVNKSSIISSNQIIEDLNNSQQTQIIANFLNCDWINGKYIDPNGDIQDFGLFSYCNNYIPAQANAVYKFISSGYAIAFYDDAYNFIELKGEPNDTVLEREFIAPQGTKYVRVNQQLSISTNFVLTEISNAYFYLNNLLVRESQIISTIKEMAKEKSRLYISSIDLNQFTINGNILISGDSTIAAYGVASSVASFINATGTKTDISVPGNTITHQFQAYNALSSGIKSAINFAIIQIGLNDLDPAESPNLALGRLQEYINTIKSTAQNAKIIVLPMIPCKKRLIDVYGSVNGIISFNKWFVMNEIISNKGILGTSSSSNYHINILSDNDYNLDPIYDIGDGIHPNTEGKKIISFNFIKTIMQF